MLLTSDLHRAPQVRNRLVQLVARAEEHAELEVRVRVLWIERDLGNLLNTNYATGYRATYQYTSATP